MALWGVERAHGPNLGLLQFSEPLEADGSLVYRRPASDGTLLKTILLFPGDGSLEVQEDNWALSNEYGMNVNFIGSYRRN